jgi:hypothetical protein
MSLWRQLTSGLRNLTHRAQADQETAEEVEHYLQEATAAFEANGLSPDDARRAARLELGGITAVRQQVRAYGWENGVSSMVEDLRYGVRRLRRSPAFVVVGALTLALGIGAGTAIFSALNPVLWQSLPYPDAGRLIAIWDGQNGTRTDVTFGTSREVIERSRSFASVAVMRPMQATVTAVAEPERLDGQYVSASYFRVLVCTRHSGATSRRPTIGRVRPSSRSSATACGAADSVPTAPSSDDRSCSTTFR